MDLIENSPELKCELFKIVRDIWAMDYAPQVLAIVLFLMLWKGPSKGSSNVLAMYSGSWADTARIINARSRSSGSASAPSRLSVPSLFVFVVIISRNVPFL